MRIDDIVYFSPKYRYSDIDFDNKECLIKAFEDRVSGFYLDPAKLLNDKKNAFGVGVICVATIDFLARISLNSPDRPRRRITEWLKTCIPEFNEYGAKRFYEDFRNGLVHEGRIKKASQFSYESGSFIYEENEIIVINPDLLLKRIIMAFNQYLDELRTNNDKFESFKSILSKDVEKDINNL